jgi:hypothetical protein
MVGRGGIRIFFMALIAGVIFIPEGAFAQQRGQPPSPPSASEIVAKMKQQLNLSDEQVNQITPVFEAEIQRMESLRTQATTRMEALRNDTESKLAQYLTPEQLAEWKNNRPQSQSGSGQQRMGSPPGR